MAAASDFIKKLEQENRALREKVSDYEKVYRVLESVSSSLNVQELIEHITNEALALCAADQGAILLFDPEEEQEAKTLIRKADRQQIKLDHFLNLFLGGWVAKNQQPLLTDNLASLIDDALLKPAYAEIKSVLSVPLKSSGKMIGVLNLIRLNPPPFGERELHLLNVLASIFGQFIHNARFHDRIFNEAVRLRKEIERQYDYSGIIGQSPQMRQVFALLDRVIPTDVRVMISGESGTGKELVAKVIHYNGPRAQKPFVAIDCGALPANLLESELFGYVKGAFTGANSDKKGLFEIANGGTLFMDEVANMPLEIQSKFLRVIQEGEIRPLGSTQVKKVDVRIISAASADLTEKIKSGEFRQDLYYRLNVVAIHLPALRERKGDVAILAHHFLEKLAKRHNKHIKGFKPDTLAHLEAYNWPGNVRELENIIERMVILADDNMLYLPVELLPTEIRPQRNVPIGQPLPSGAPDIKSRKTAYEKTMLLEALIRNNWNQSAAARELGISERSVRYKMKKLGLEKP